MVHKRNRVSLCWEQTANRKDAQENTTGESHIAGLHFEFEVAMRRGESSARTLPAVKMKDLVIISLTHQAKYASMGHGYRA